MRRNMIITLLIVLTVGCGAPTETDTRSLFAIAMGELVVTTLNEMSAYQGLDGVIMIRRGDTSTAVSIQVSGLPAGTGMLRAIVHDVPCGVNGANSVYRHDLSLALGTEPSNELGVTFVPSPNGYALVTMTGPFQARSEAQSVVIERGVGVNSQVLACGEFETDLRTAVANGEFTPSGGSGLAVTGFVALTRSHQTARLAAVMGGLSPLTNYSLAFNQGRCDQVALSSLFIARHHPNVLQRVAVSAPITSDASGSATLSLLVNYPVDTGAQIIVIRSLVGEVVGCADFTFSPILGSELTRLGQFVSDRNAPATELGPMVGQATLTRSLQGSTLLTVSVDNLPLTNATYQAVLSDASCYADSDDPFGPYYRIVDSIPFDPSTNQFWITLMTDASGHAEGEHFIDYHIARADARSVLIIAPDGVFNRVACADLNVSSYPTL